MKNKAIILGAGGSAKVILDIINKKYKEIIILDDDAEKHNIWIGYNSKVVGSISTIINYDRNLYDIYLGIGSTGSLKNRIHLYDRIKTLKYDSPPLISESANVSNMSEISNGCVIFPGAIINAGAYLGENVLINTGAIIEHDCNIDDNSFISPNVTICGNVCIGKNVFIGAGSTIIGNIIIRDGSLIGAGSTVIKNVSCDRKLYGNPAHKNMRTK